MIDALLALGVSESTIVTWATFIAAAGIGASAGWYFLRGSPWASQLFGALSIGFFIGTCTLVWRPPATDAELEHPLPERMRNQGYASSDSCRSCHPGQYESWHNSFHRTMTQTATPEAVQAPFDGRVLSERGRNFQLARQGGAFYVREISTPNPVESDEAFFAEAARVVMTTGSHNMQAFWFESGDGRLEQIPFIYLIAERRWVANSDSFLEPPHEVTDGLVRYTWSDSCVTCHATGGPWDAPHDQPDSTPEATVTEFGISCEACHGPGQEHVQANRSPARRYALRPEDSEDPTIINPATLTNRRSASICGRCHSVHPDGQGERVHDFRPGEMIDEYLSFQAMFDVVDQASEIVDLDWLPYDERDTVGSFWRDGSVRVAGREHTGMIRSGCYLEGDMDCTSCHSMHESDPSKQLSGPATDDEMCTSCHTDHALDPGAHTHHPASSSGSRCVNCHMPYSSYGLLMTTRSHRMDGPAATGQGGRGRPNACNLCHLDESIGWTAVHLSRWYGAPAPNTAEREDELAAGLHWMLRGDATQRALVAWHVSWEPAVAASDLSVLQPALEALLSDPYASVRQVAGASLMRIDPNVVLDMDAIAADPIPSSLEDPELLALLRERDDTSVTIPE